MTVVSEAGDERDPVASRFARLASGVSGLGRRRGLDVERTLLIAGSVLVPVGVLFILLGWDGAAHTSRLFEQIPYLISGGILGGALVIAGGFLYFSYWLTRLVYEGRTQNRDLIDVLVRMDERLAALESGSGGGAAGVSASLVATATGSMVHRRDCPVVADKAGLREVTADAPGLKPCRICEPFAAV